MLRDYGKLLGLLGALAAVTVLLMTDNLDPVAGAGLIGTIVGYLTGNGQNAVNGNAPSTVFSPPPGKVAELAQRRAYDAGAADAVEDLRQLDNGNEAA